MSVTNQTGNQCRFIWDVNGTPIQWTVAEIGEWGWDRIAIPDDNLASTQWAETLPSSLYAIRPMPMVLRWDQTNVIYRREPEEGLNTAVKLCQLITPQGSGAHALQGQAFFLSWGMPAMSNNDRLNISVAVQWDGRLLAWTTAA